MWSSLLNRNDITRAWLVAQHGEAKAEKIAAAYRNLFQAKSAGLVLADLGALAHEVETSFDPDPYRTAFNEGQRSVLLHILYLARSLPKETRIPEDEGENL